MPSSFSAARRASSRHWKAHARAHALVKARRMKTDTILVNISGRGDKDMDYVIEDWGIGTPA